MTNAKSKYIEPFLKCRTHPFSKQEIQPRPAFLFLNNSQAGSKLNDGNLFPGQSPRRFFESDRDILHTYSMSPHDDPTDLTFFFFLP